MNPLLRTLRRRCSRVLPLILVLALLTPLAHWLSMNDDDELVSGKHQEKDYKPRFGLQLPVRPSKDDSLHDGYEVHDVMRDQFEYHVNYVVMPQAREQKDDEAHGQSEVRPTEIRKSMIVQLSEFPMKDTMVHVIGRQRATPAYLTIGIPSVYRQMSGTQYLATTIKSLLENMDPDEEMPDVQILVFAADFDIKLRKEVVDIVQRSFPRELESGVLQVLTVDAAAYPPLTDLKRNYNDPDERVTWRAKQVVDFAFMFYYARNLSQFYLQIEDDVMSSPHFVSMIRAFVASQNHHWVALDFSTLGFIGKLIRSSDLEEFARFLLMFYDEQPVDYLYILFMKILVQDRPILHRPTLFQHFGEHSSLAGKASMRIYKDKFFALGRDAKLPVFSIVVNTTKNPAAQILTSIEAYSNFVPEAPYGDTTGYFWGKTPRVDDVYMIIFKSPQKLKSLFVETGRETQQNDFLRQGVLEISPPSNSSSIKSSENSQFEESVSDASKRQCGEFTKIDDFDKGVVLVENVDRIVDDLTLCVRIRVTNSQEEWVIINNIIIKTIQT